MTIDIEGAVCFHGHLCAGLATGIRVSEYALREFGPRSPDEELVAVVETRSCSVDAIQYLTGCTFGKGNLIHLDYGKNAFRFYQRASQRAIRVRQRPTALPAPDPLETAVIAAWRAGTADEEQLKLAEAYRNQRIDLILSTPLDELIESTEIDPNPPPFARIFDSIPCGGCGEKTQETLLTLFEGKTLCGDCFQQALHQ